MADRLPTFWRRMTVAAIAIWLAIAQSALAQTALIDAVRQGDVAAVRKLAPRSADVNRPEPDGTTALHWAARRGDLAMVDTLLAESRTSRAPIATA
jgi:ankyrin repeat protein